VLENYTTYGTYFELLENEKAPPGYEVESAKGRRMLMQQVGRHPHTIESKAKIMLDHFFTKTAHKIGGEAKAMVVAMCKNANVTQIDGEFVATLDNGSQVGQLITTGKKLRLSSESS
jgi:type I restriction enzyme R subunit